MLLDEALSHSFLVQQAAQVVPHLYHEHLLHDGVLHVPEALWQDPLLSPVTQIRVNLDLGLFLLQNNTSERTLDKVTPAFALEADVLVLGVEWDKLGRLGEFVLKSIEPHLWMLAVQ